MKSADSIWYEFFIFKFLQHHSSMDNKKNMKIKKKIFLIVYCIVFFFLCCSCTRENMNDTIEVNEITELLLKLPNLKSLDIVKCKLLLEKRNNSRRLVPSPSDITLRLVGSITLDEISWKDIKSRYVWKVVSRDLIAADLSTTLPDGAVFVSYKFNESFSNNPTFAHGFIVIVEGVEKKIFLLATDIDHPIQ